MSKLYRFAAMLASGKVANDSTHYLFPRRVAEYAGR